MSEVRPDRRRVRIVLAYDGTDYHGWQVQPSRPTVQGVLEGALTRLEGGRPVRVRGAGRTDAGVHARGQVADCMLEAATGDAELLHRLSRLLPEAIRPHALETVAADFDARRHAVEKRYVYRIDRSPCGDPFVHRYAMHYRRPLDADAIEAALGKLPGRRDWSGFAGAGCEVEDRVRNLMDARLEPDGHELRFVFAGDGFLNHMVRNIVGTLLEIGRGRFAPGRIEEILAAGDRRLAGPTAPARGLCLERVRYAEDGR